MAALYSAGDPQIVFQAGYDMQSFLFEFLQYYTCRPLYARTYVFKDKLAISGLPVEAENLYRYVLDKEKSYGLRVIRMNMPSVRRMEESFMEYLLACHSELTVRDSIFQHSFFGVHGSDEIVFRSYQLIMRDKSDRFISPVFVNKPATKDWLCLEFYVVYVDARKKFPLDCEKTDNGR
ncbi:unnamed protein product [Soboliphyme baturini]|uniref:PAZ domain-containing protein n=1 Tax=Soboliphyme baturini TaxID=241478 RepID=A0A183J841_9BILA|nr:unnamed protein product [Soboliphyme baturini]